MVLVGDLEIRPYRPGDEGEILALFQLCFGWDLSMSAWVWRYRDNPVGRGIIGLCWDGDILVAHYSLTALIMRIGGRDCLLASPGATMTHPDYRGRKLFPKLARRVYDQAHRLGVMMIYSFPNRFSHRGYARDLGRHEIYEVPTFRLSLEGGLPLPNPSDNIVELTGFDVRFDRLWERVSPRYPVITKRDATYLEWRYVQNPTQYRILAYLDSGEVLGYVVLKRYRDELHIVDMLTLDDHVGEQLVWEAAHVALDVGASSLSLWLGVTRPLHWSLERIGFRNEEPVTYFSALTLRPNFTDTDVYSFYNWYVTMGDSDVY